MKKTLLLLSGIIGLSAVGLGQCDQKTVLTSSKTEYLDANFTLQRAVDEKSVIEISKTDISITAGSEEHKMTGPIKSDSCGWAKAFKEGKRVVKAAITDSRGGAKNATITIEGKAGKITLLFEVDDMPGKKIRIVADTFEEKK